ncbi:MAG: deaminase [Candidatus Harrisonbacteria bacterium]|nr:deaminase [Candidatus Harrisonbacteria bacterium]
MKVILAYIPVLHEGYRRLFEKHKDAEILYILGKEFLSEKPLSKDIRALDPPLAASAVAGWKIFPKIEVLNTEGVRQLDQAAYEIIAPNDELMRALLENFKNAKVEFENIFLRWDKHRSMEARPVEIDQKISKEEFDRKILKNLSEEAEAKSSDIWRRIGAAILKDGNLILSTYNRHVPSEHAHLVSGDPRSNFSKGVRVELSSVLHSEAGLIAEAAKRGICLEGTDMYVSTFPCPPCAKSIAYSGVKRLLYTGGYGMLDGEDVLKNQGVEIIFVDMK